MKVEMRRQVEMKRQWELVEKKAGAFPVGMPAPCDLCHHLVMPMVLLNLNLLLKHISPSLLHHHHLQLKNWKLKYYVYSLFANIN